MEENEKCFPSYEEFIEWYKTCRQFDITRDDIYTAMQMISRDNYDDKTALHLMATYNKTVCEPCRRSKKDGVMLEACTEDTRDVANWCIGGIILGAILGVVGTIILYAMI